LTDTLLLTLFFFLAALLYSSVGHAGASGYLAAMALLGTAPSTMKPTALALNIIVATIATFKFYRAGYFRWSLLWPFALTSVPFAFLGGTFSIPEVAYKPLVGLTLIYAAFKMLLVSHHSNETVQKPLTLPLALVFGSIIGLLSGLTGVGGGIFLTPLLLFLGWAKTRESSGVSAAFILFNSVAGLAGLLTKSVTMPSTLAFYSLSVVIGGWIGAEYGSRRLTPPTWRKLLALVLLIAGGKMLLVLVPHVSGNLHQ